jgi:predicted DNA-binding transcriptional regulator AlpA
MPKPDSKLLRTAAEVIDALGQPRVSELTGKSYKRVWGWGADGAFPSRYFLEMWLELVQRGYYAPPSLWHQELSRNNEAALGVLARKLQAA